jgi:hypothetical protein
MQMRNVPHCPRICCRDKTGQREQELLYYEDNLAVIGLLSGGPAMQFPPSLYLSEQASHLMSAVSLEQTRFLLPYGSAWSGGIVWMICISGGESAFENAGPGLNDLAKSNACFLSSYKRPSSS